MKTLSVVLATRNEEENIEKCLESVKAIADEIVVVDEYSTDMTASIAKSCGAKVHEEKHEDIFHKTKQKALDYAQKDWILQLDADEVVSEELGREIIRTINLENDELKKLRIEKLKNGLFRGHQNAVEFRDGVIGKDTGEIVGFFIPRKNFFLGAPLVHGGVYPDAVIRLVKNKKGYFTGKSVHDQIQLEGEVSWLSSDLIHNDSPTFSKYISRFNRYTSLHSNELSDRDTPKNFIYLVYYSVVRAKFEFLKRFVLHAGFKDGVRGFVWAMFSAWHFPIAYFKYWTK